MRHGLLRIIVVLLVIVGDVVVFLICIEVQYVEVDVAEVCGGRGGWGLLLLLRLLWFVILIIIIM